MRISCVITTAESHLDWSLKRFYSSVAADTSWHNFALTGRKLYWILKENATIKNFTSSCQETTVYLLSRARYTTKSTDRFVHSLVCQWNQLRDGAHSPKQIRKIEASRKGTSESVIWALVSLFRCVGSLILALWELFWLFQSNSIRSSISRYIETW